MPGSENNRNFDISQLKHELQDLVTGDGGERPQNIIQSIACYLRRSKKVSAGTQKIQYSKEQETEVLIVSMALCDIVSNLNNRH
jgi:hypothetical protein